MTSEIFIFCLPENLIEFCDRSKVLLQEKQVGENSDIINEEMVAIAHEQLEYKSSSTKQHIFLTNKCLN